MKRKHLEDVDDDFSFARISAKSRRLDAELLWSMEKEVPTISLPLAPAFEKQHEHLPSPSIVQSEEEKAIVLYNPSNSNPFLRSPASLEFSVIVKSDLIPALKDYLYRSENSRPLVTVEDETAGNESTQESNDCLAVVPWVAPQHHLTSGTEAVTSESMEAENMDVEMMDAEDNRSLHYGDMTEGAEGLQQRQQQLQHCMAPQLPQNISTPVTW